MARAPYHNRQRTHDEEALRRKLARQRGEYLESLKPRFKHWARNNGVSEDEIEKGVNRLDEIVDFYDELAEGGVPDEQPRLR